ncbi:hypothetical protein Cob_v004083 [Colletotrichum orbiculare MAFF 240422]|uniref:Uncharacterized protein n=1 Tax=Colletotrichum orbiculare (strain 104-T / ATCC 96160 / CBS 514.97 / LARS 414 / MAFF 240422) TaxID=1213857 RepID=A0A484FYV6_COLOR|nr:hypothetical protein Cob_v004083 [Colletotrichum orbiculare MAFF 240422]
MYSNCHGRLFLDMCRVRGARAGRCRRWSLEAIGVSATPFSQPIESAACHALLLITNATALEHIFCRGIPGRSVLVSHSTNDLFP